MFRGKGRGKIGVTAFPKFLNFRNDVFQAYTVVIFKWKRKLVKFDSKLTTCIFKVRLKHFIHQKKRNPLTLRDAQTDVKTGIMFPHRVAYF